MQTRQAYILSVIFFFVSQVLLAAEKYAPVSVDMQIKKVSEHVYYVEGKPGIATDNEGFISNAGFIVTGDGVIIFDALGSPSLAYTLIQKIKTITDQPIKKVIVSHFHADHIYGLQVFEALGIEIIAPYGAQKYIQSDSAKQFTLGDLTFTLNYMGKAHSDGDLTLLVEPDKVLFSGDIIFEGRIPYVGSADSKKWLETLTKLEINGLNALIPGHGPASHSPEKTISLTRRYLAFLRKTLGEGIEDLTPFDEVYEAADWSAFEKLPAFKEGNRINAYQVYLSMEAELLQQD